MIEVHRLTSSARRLLLCGIGQAAKHLEIGDHGIHLGQPAGSPSKARTLVASP
jgi:hypothetical protein